MHLLHQTMNSKIVRYFSRLRFHNRFKLIHIHYVSHVAALESVKSLAEPHLAEN